MIFDVQVDDVIDPNQLSNLVSKMQIKGLKDYEKLGELLANKMGEGVSSAKSIIYTNFIQRT